jgi:hypothetical protein
MQVVFVHGFPDHSDRPELKSFTEKVAWAVVTGVSPSVNPTLVIPTQIS